MNNDTTKTTTVFDHEMPFGARPAVAPRRVVEQRNPTPAAPAAPRRRYAGDHVDRISELRRAGASLAEIAAEFGVTRERIRQILVGAGVTAQDARRGRRAAHDAAVAELRTRVLAWVRTRPGQTTAAAAEALGTTPAMIREALGAATIGRLFVHEAGNAQRQYTPADLIGWIQAAAVVHGSPLAGTAYDEFSAAHGGPSRVLLLQRFDTWNAACSQAGLAVNFRHDGYHRRWTETQMLELVADYLCSADSRGTYADYDRWAREGENRPSGQTLRNTIGPWRDIKTAAQVVVTDRRLAGLWTLKGDS